MYCIYLKKNKIKIFTMQMPRPRCRCRDFQMAYSHYFYINNPTAQLKNVSLHGFCDASKSAYATVIYFLSENIDGEKYCSLIVGKTKVAAIKNVSIPKSELLACVLLTILIRYVISSMGNVLGFSDIYRWSDSLDALYWMKRVNKNWDVFINNKVSKIRLVVDPL